MVDSAGTRKRIVAAARALLAQGGVEAMSTRAVSIAAGVHPPMIYRIFGDKRQLLDAVACEEFAHYLASKSAVEPSDDPVHDLRDGWDRHIRFGLGSPHVYAAVYGAPRPEQPFRAQVLADELLGTLVHRIAAAGRLAIPPAQAVRVVDAAGRGTVLALIGVPVEGRDPQLSALVRESVISAVTTAGPAGPEHSPLAGAAITLRAGLDQARVLSAGERQLMGEWLDRLQGA